MAFNGQINLFPIAFPLPESLMDTYLKEIRADISSCGWRISLKECVVMRSKSKLIIKDVGVLELARHSIKYRTKLAKNIGIYNVN